VGPLIQVTDELVQIVLQPVWQWFAFCSSRSAKQCTSGYSYIINPTRAYILIFQMPLLIAQFQHHEQGTHLGQCIKQARVLTVAEHKQGDNDTQCYSMRHAPHACLQQVLAGS
jgi:hypothetical protein